MVRPRELKILRSSSSNGRRRSQEASRSSEHFWRSVVVGADHRYSREQLAYAAVVAAFTAHCSPCDGQRRRPLPGQVCDTYRVQVLYAGGGVPEVQVLRPAARAANRRSAHVPPGSVVPVFARHWRVVGWEASRLAIVPWASLWLYFYEVWRVGEWLEGAEGTRDKVQIRKGEAIMSDRKSQGDERVPFAFVSLDGSGAAYGGVRRWVPGRSERRLGCRIADYFDLIAGTGWNNHRLPLALNEPAGRIVRRSTGNAAREFSSDGAPAD